MRIDATRHNEFARGIYFLVGCNGQVPADGSHGLTFDEYIRDIIIGCGNDAAILY
jgi:hypothetical protein